MKEFITFEQLENYVFEQIESTETIKLVDIIDSLDTSKIVLSEDEHENVEHINNVFAKAFVNGYYHKDFIEFVNRYTHNRIIVFLLATFTHDGINLDYTNKDFMKSSEYTDEDAIEWFLGRFLNVDTPTDKDKLENTLLRAVLICFRDEMTKFEDYNSEDVSDYIGFELTADTITMRMYNYFLMSSSVGDRDYRIKNDLLHFIRLYFSSQYNKMA